LRSGDEWWVGAINPVGKERSMPEFEYEGEELEAYLQGQRDYEEFMASHLAGSQPSRVELIAPAEEPDTEDPLGFMRSTQYQPPYEYKEAYDEGWQSVRDQ
jgi:hypothetical protein